MSEGRPTLLFTAPRAKIVVTPSLGVLWDDRARRSCAPDASGHKTEAQGALWKRPDFGGGASGLGAVLRPVAT